MAFGTKNQLVGLDIGSRILKAAEIVETKKGLRLKKFGTIEIPSGLIEDGTINDSEKVAEYIRQLFKDNKIMEHNVAVSIGGFSVIVKKIYVQKMDEIKLQETIQFEAEQYIPFDISDVNLDFQILGENENNPNQMSVFLVAAKKEMINEYINLVQMAGLNPCIIDVEAFALQNIFEFNYDETNENIALIDIGASKTSLNILKGFSSLFMRDVSLGCGQINQKIVSLAGCTIDEAEKIKLGNKDDKISNEDLKEIISSVVSDWCAEIKRALDFFYSTYPDDAITKIILSGGGANIIDFRQLLSMETSAEVELIDPFSQLELADSLDSLYLKKIAPQAAISVGLALRRIDDK
ncbi:MAG: pilus assembly protein PilM [Proteobacteria bacterium]|nr:pilus assembly protein PilM [Pseudomonadota bacterium]